MFYPLSLFVGLRYVRSRTHKFFVSFITWASLVGVCVGVAALIVILSVMNGLETELRDRLLSLNAHIRVTAQAGLDATSTDRAAAAPQDGSAATPPAAAPPVATSSIATRPIATPPIDWAAAQRAIQKVPGVAGVAPYVELQALAVRTPEMLPVVLRGIDPQSELSVTDLAHAITQGRFSDLVAGENRMIVGAVVADRLGLGIGDSVTVLIPTVTEGGAPIPKLREFTVAGTFEVGQPDHDGTLVFAHIDDVKGLTPSGQSGEGLRVRLNDAFAAPAVAALLRAKLPKQFEVTDWTQDNASYFRAIRIEKTMMSLILLLIVAIAAFNIIAMLVMVVTDKRTDIAILRTLGASPRKVMGIFITQGLVIGWIGVALGLGLGLALAYNVGAIVPFLEHTFRFQILDADVYLITTIPAEVRRGNIITIAIAALALTGAATIYPAIRAARTAPAEALRYE